MKQLFSKKTKTYAIKNQILLHLSPVPTEVKDGIVRVKPCERGMNGYRSSGTRLETGFGRVMAHDLGVPAHFGIRTMKYKLIFFYGIDYGRLLTPSPENWGSQDSIVTPPGWEFYDLETDPHEMNNLYNDPDYKGIIEDLKSRLETIRKELNETDEKYPNIQKIIDEHWDD